MKEAVDKTVEALRKQNILLAQQQSITTGLLAYWEQVQKGMDEALAAETNVVEATPVPVPPTTPTPVAAQDRQEASDERSRWLRDVYTAEAADVQQGKDLVQDAIKKDAQLVTDPALARLQQANENLAAATATFQSQHRKNHGRVDQPTPTPVAAESFQPTVVDTPPVSDPQFELRLLINQFLSPKISKYGRGFLMPKQDLAQYQEDITRVPLVNKKNWPTGFYREEGSSAMQLFINHNGFHVTVKKVSADADLGDIEVWDLSTGAITSDVLKMPMPKKVVHDTIRFSLAAVAKPAA